MLWWCAWRVVIECSPQKPCLANSGLAQYSGVTELLMTTPASQRAFSQRMIELATWNYMCDTLYWYITVSPTSCHVPSSMHKIASHMT